MSDEQLLAQLAELRAEYKLGVETVEMIRAELRDSVFQRDIEKFICALGQALPHTRRFQDTFENIDTREDDALAIAELASKLKARLMLSESPLVSMLLMQIEDTLGEKASEDFIDGLYLRLDILQAAANEDIGAERSIKKGRPGPKNDAASWFVAIVAHHWQIQMPDTKITPSGAFKRICMGIVRLEGLRFKITRPAIEAGISLLQSLKESCA